MQVITAIALCFCYFIYVTLLFMGARLGKSSFVTAATVKGALIVNILEAAAIVTIWLSNHPSNGWMVAIMVAFLISNIYFVFEAVALVGSVQIITRKRVTFDMTVGAASAALVSILAFG